MRKGDDGEKKKREGKNGNKLELSWAKLKLSFVVVLIYVLVKVGEEFVILVQLLFCLA